jgi:hypothetical protein
VSTRNLIVVVFLVVVAVALVLHFWPQPKDDCTFSAWKRTTGVDVDISVADVERIKAKVGLSDEQVRDFDDLMKDFALKYDAACRDYKNGPMPQAEYSCRRKNMDETLDRLRTFAVKVKAVGTLDDESAKREGVMKAFEDLEAASRKGAGTGCTSAMNADPKKLQFSKNTPERSLRVSNSGNNPINFSLTDLPMGFISVPSTDEIGVGKTSTVAIFRTLDPVAASPITIRLTNNYGQDIPIEIELDQKNASPYDELAQQLMATTPGSAPTVEDALAIVDKSISADLRTASPRDLDAMRYVIAAGVLSRAGRTTEANTALTTATSKNPALAQEPSVLTLRGIVATRAGKTDDAVKDFDAANKLTGPRYRKEQRAYTDLLTAAAVSQEDPDRASKLLGGQDVQEQVKANPALVPFVSKELKVHNLGNIVSKARVTVEKTSVTP